MSFKPAPSAHAYKIWISSKELPRRMRALKKYAQEYEVIAADSQDAFYLAAGIHSRKTGLSTDRLSFVAVERESD